jgi:LPXTG-motif cell wall-anchored protein
MDTTTVIRVVAGALAILVLFVIVWRRKRKALE